MKQFFRDYFTFNKRERNGVFILISIITILVLYLNISSNFIHSEPVDFTKFEQDVKVFKAELQASADSAKPVYEKHLFPSAAEKPILAKAERFDFDPNDLPDKDWKRLGLSVKQIHSIKNYEAKGGKFRTKQDVKKMYAIPAEQYVSLEPFIHIASEEKPAAVFVSEKSVVSAKKPTIAILELNAADSAQLTTLKGIGPFFAKTIIKYRNSIGGFVAKEQLLEVWKFDQEKLDEIEKFIIVDASKIKKVDINTCEAAELKSAYIKWNVANAIVNYRKSHGRYATLEDIKKTDLVDDETYRKIVPYLVIE